MATLMVALAVTQPRQLKSGSKAVGHSEDCRRRIMNAMSSSDEGRKRLKAADERTQQKRGREPGDAEMEGKAATEEEWLKKLQEQVEMPEVSQDAEMTNRVQKRSHETEADDSVRMTEASSSSSSSSSPALQEAGGLLAYMGLEPAKYFVSEFFCKDRFTSKAEQFGLGRGWAFDLTTGCDLSIDEQCAEAWRSCSRQKKTQQQHMMSTNLLSTDSKEKRLCFRRASCVELKISN